MAIPFYENEEENLQQSHFTSQLNAEVDQVDGPAFNSQNVNTSPPSQEFVENHNEPINENDSQQAWKILAVAMCKALKDFHQQNITQSTTNAVIQILPNGQVKHKWN